MSIEEQSVPASPRQRRLQWIIPIAGLLVYSVLTWSVWQWLWREWMGNDYYSHGILIVPVALYLAWRRLANQGGEGIRAHTLSYSGMAVLVVGMAAYLFFIDYRAYYLAAFAAILLLTGLVWTWTGTQTVKLLAFPLAYLVLMVPLPFIERSTLPLALFTGVCSAALVKFLGLDITVTGNAITLPNADLVIGAQCSGINSMIALVSLNALVAYVVKGPWWGRIGLIVLAVPIAMAGNILRVANLLFVARSWGAEAAFRFYHDYSGIVFFVLVLLLLLPLTRLLHCSKLRSDVL